MVGELRALRSSFTEVPFVTALNGLPRNLGTILRFHEFAAEMMWFRIAVSQRLSRRILALSWNRNRARLSPRPIETNM